MYILSELPKMQNMKSFAVNEHTNIDEFVREIKTLPDGSKIYRFFKELLAYTKTLVAFSPYNRVNDQRMVGPLDQYYADALAAYGEVNYLSQQIGPQDEEVLRGVSTCRSRSLD